MKKTAKSNQKLRFFLCKINLISFKTTGRTKHSAISKLLHIDNTLRMSCLKEIDFETFCNNNALEITGFRHKW